MIHENRPALSALEKFNIDVCVEVGAGKGHATTDDARKAWREKVYERRAELADLITDAERELRNLPDAPGITGHTNGRWFIEGFRQTLADIVHPR